MAEAQADDVARIVEFCAQRSPAEVADEVRIEAVVSDSTVTIEECRAPWEPSLVDWTRTPVAQLRHSTGSWTLYCPDGESRWHRYRELHSGSIDELLAEIDDDPTGVFWG